eukprot:1194949-Prorocentrum_minimum.AAC.2
MRRPGCRLASVATGDRPGIYDSRHCTGLVVITYLRFLPGNHLYLLIAYLSLPWELIVGARNASLEGVNDWVGILQGNIMKHVVRVTLGQGGLINRVGPALELLPAAVA